MFRRRHFADGVKIGDVTDGAGLNGDLDDLAMGEHHFQTANDPTTGLQGQTREVSIDVDEVSRAIGKFENEACDHYPVIFEETLNDHSAELARGACGIGVEVGYQHDSRAVRG